MSRAPGDSDLLAFGLVILGLECALDGHRATVDAGPMLSVLQDAGIVSSDHTLMALMAHAERMREAGFPPAQPPPAGDAPAPGASGRPAAFEAGMSAAQWARVLHAGWAAVPGKSEPAANALAIALMAMENEARAIALEGAGRR